MIFNVFGHQNIEDLRTEGSISSPLPFYRKQNVSTIQDIRENPRNTTHLENFKLIFKYLKRHNFFHLQFPQSS